MSRKDYVAIAAALNRAKPVESQCADSHRTWNDVVYAVASAFAEDNARFNRQTFVNACTLDKP